MAKKKQLKQEEAETDRRNAELYVQHLEALEAQRKEALDAISRRQEQILSSNANFLKLLNKKVSGTTLAFTSAQWTQNVDAPKSRDERPVFFFLETIHMFPCACNRRRRSRNGSTGVQTSHS